MSQASIVDHTSLEKSGQHLARNSAKAILGTLLSRGCGVIRTLIINATFGANTTLDAFNVAFRFPNSLRDLFADGALSAAFIKVLVDTHPKGEAAIRKLVSVVSGFFLTLTLLLAIIGVIFAKPFLTLVSGQQFAVRGSLNLAILLFQILVFYLPLTMLNAIVMGVLGIKGDTFRAMNGSIFLSVGMILGALLVAPCFYILHLPEILGLAVGAMLGIILQLFYQAYPLWKWNLLVLPCFDFRLWCRYKPLHQVITLMTPRALGQGAMVLALMINTFFAIQIGAGVFTYISTTVIIIQVPIGLFGVATGFAALPLLSAAFNENNQNLFNHLLHESLNTAKWLSLLTLIFFAFLIVPSYMVIFQHGKITFYDTIQNSIAICAYGIGIFFATNGKILLNALYAVNATRQIVINSLIYLLVNVSLSAILAPKLGIIGLGGSFATATAVDCWLNFFVVRRATKKHFKNKNILIKETESHTTIDSTSSKNIPSSVKTKIHTHFIKPSRFLFFSVLSYIFGFFGIIVCRYFWPHFTELTHIELTWIIALVILFIFAPIMLIIFLIILRWYGPHQLQTLIRKIY